MLEGTKGINPTPSTTGSESPVRRRKGASPDAEGFARILRQQHLRQQAQQAQDRPLPPGEFPVHFSKHAQQRLEKRAISLGPEQGQRLAKAVDAAAARGARQSLVVLDGVALVVNVQNRTVVTALGATSGSNRVFTNIDSAVVA